MGGAELEAAKYGGSWGLQNIEDREGESFLFPCILNIIFIRQCLHPQMFFCSLRFKTEFIATGGVAVERQGGKMVCYIYFPATLPA